MARIYLSGAPDVELGLDYNASNGRVNGLYCDNQSGWLVHGVARLTDGRVFERDFPVGTTLLSIPGGVLTVGTEVNDEGETVSFITGLASYSLGIQYNTAAR